MWAKMPGAAVASSGTMPSSPAALPDFFLAKVMAASCQVGVRAMSMSFARGIMPGRARSSRAARWRSSNGVGTPLKASAKCSNHLVLALRGSAMGMPWASLTICQVLASWGASCLVRW